MREVQGGGKAQREKLKTGHWKDLRAARAARSGVLMGSAACRGRVLVGYAPGSGPNGLGLPLQGCSRHTHPA